LYKNDHFWLKLAFFSCVIQKKVVPLRRISKYAIYERNYWKSRRATQGAVKTMDSLILAKIEKFICIYKKKAVILHAFTIL